MEQLYVNENSWHYELATLGDSFKRAPKNLCAYFWTCVFKFFVTLILVLTVGFLLALFLGVLLDPFITYGVLVLCDYTPHHTFMASTLGTDTDHYATPIEWYHFCFTWFVYCLVALVVLNENSSRIASSAAGARMSKFTTKVKRGSGFFGLVYAFLVARKNQLCPTIKYIRD